MTDLCFDYIPASLTQLAPKVGVHNCLQVGEYHIRRDLGLAGFSFETPAQGDGFGDGSLGASSRLLQLGVKS